MQKRTSTHDHHQKLSFGGRLEKIFSARLPNPLSLLDFYIIQSFLTPFFLCFFGFLAIWLIFDLSDNLPDFIRGKVSPLDVAGFYAAQLPQIALITFPVGLLLALLYSLSKLSRSNELVAMLSAGRSIPRILAPLLAIGILISIVSTGLSYHLAPWAEAEKEARLNAILSGETKKATLFAQVFRNRKDHRTWHIRRMPRDMSELKGVQIIQQNANDEVIFTYNVQKAFYDPAHQSWHFTDGVQVFFDYDGNVVTWKHLEKNEIRGWSETPERIISSNMKPELMGVDELRRYLYENADFPEKQLAPFITYLHHRWALPWSCFVVVLIASPLGIAFSRGGMLSNVATSIFLFFGMIFFMNLFLSLGQAGHISPFAGAWFPDLFFSLLGLYLLYLRSTNRELPKLNLRDLSLLLQKPSQRPPLK